MDTNPHQSFEQIILSLPKSGTVEGIRTDRSDGTKTKVTLKYTIEKGLNGYKLQIHEGVTGFESMYLNKDIFARYARPDADDWHACVGISNAGPYAGWDDLFISINTLRKALGIVV